MKKSLDDAKNVSASTKGEALISLLAKKIIADNNLDINLIAGKGPGGRIMKEDVLEFMAANQRTDRKSFSGFKK